jgi:hypothetical protein
MSQRGKHAILRLAKNIIASNSEDTPARKRLKGNLHERGGAIRKLESVIFTLRIAGTGREWKRDASDTVIHELRTQASDVRLPASIRSRAIVRLAVVEGFLPVTELGDEPIDQYLKSIVVPAQETPDPTPAKRDAAPLNADMLDFSGVGRK